MKENVMQFLKKNAVLICIMTSIILFIIASLAYPGGSLANPNSIGFNWTENFISNLFGANAINGEENISRIWALLGIAFYSIGNGLFFIHFSNKLNSKHASNVLLIVGYTNIIFTVLVATPLHDSMVTISSTTFLIGLFYITVYLLKTKLHLLKIASIISLLLFYYTLFLYGTANWGLLATMQKITFISSMILVVLLEYFTKKEDFSL